MIEPRQSNTCGTCRSSAYTSARCVYFSVETVVKVEWNLPARPSQLTIASRRCSSIDASRPSPCSASTSRLRSPSDRQRAASRISSMVCIGALTPPQIYVETVEFWSAVAGLPGSRRPYGARRARLGGPSAGPGRHDVPPGWPIVCEWPINPRAAASCPSTTSVPLGPVFDRELLEPDEILCIRGDEDELIRVSDRRDLAVNEWGWAPECLETGSLLAVPPRRRLVVRQHRKGGTDDVTEIAIERCAPLAFGQPATTVRELVPDWRCDRAFRAVVLELLDNGSVRLLGDRRGHDARVQQIAQRHRATFRPRVLSRVAARRLSSRPIPISEC